MIRTINKEKKSVDSSIPFLVMLLLHTNNLFEKILDLKNIVHNLIMGLQLNTLNNKRNISQNSYLVKLNLIMFKEILKTQEFDSGHIFKLKKATNTREPLNNLTGL